MSGKRDFVKEYESNEVKGEPIRRIVARSEYQQLLQHCGGDFLENYLALNTVKLGDNHSGDGASAADGVALIVARFDPKRLVATQPG